MKTDCYHSGLGEKPSIHIHSPAILQSGHQGTHRLPEGKASLHRQLRSGLGIGMAISFLWRFFAWRRAAIAPRQTAREAAREAAALVDPERQKLKEWPGAEDWDYVTRGYIEVSTNGGSPKWLVETVDIFQESTISIHII